MGALTLLAPRGSRLARWVTASISLGLCVIALLSWLHYEERRVRHEASEHLRELRETRISLAKGFLHVSLADAPESPFSRSSGVALLQQSVASFERSLARQGRADGPEAEAFRRSAGDFGRALEDWRQANGSDAQAMVALRVAFGDLERRVAEVDAAAQRHIDALALDMERVYAVSLLGSLLALGLIVGLVRNIARKEQLAVAEQLRMAQERRESEERFRSLLQNLEGMVYRCRNLSDFIPEFVSEGCRTTLGYAAADLMAGRPAYGSLIHPEDRQRVWQGVQGGIAAKQAIQMEYRVRHADGQWRWVLGKGLAAFDEAGNFRHLEGFVTDITARKTAEAALRLAAEELEARIAQRTRDLVRANEELARREEELRSLLDNLVDGVIHTDSRGIVRSANPALAQILGYAPEELVGKNVSLLIPGPHRGAHDGYINHYLRTNESQIVGVGREVEGLHKGGRRVLLELAVSEYRVHGERLFTGILRDVTERRQAEAERKRITDLLDNVLAAASEVSIVATDPDGLITIFNSGAERMLGYRAEDVVGRLTPMGFHLPDELAARAEALAAELGRPVEGFRIFVEKAEREGSETREWTYLHKDGHRIPISLVVTPMRNPAGGIIGYLGIAQSIGERKRIVAELERARETAEAANRAKSAFLATMSHEVRTPMNGIIGTADVLRRAMLTPHQAELVETIRDSALSLLSVINDVLDFSKIEADRLELEREPVSIARLLETACVALQPVAAHSDVRIAVFADPRLPEWILADAVRLRQIINNLVFNAIKFSAREGGQGVVKVRAEPAGEHGLRLTVSDNGIGMTPEVVARIFSPFIQADASTTRRFGGTGLGLSICKRLVELMNGTIGVQSQPGVGSVFTVTLPVEGDPARHPEALAFDLSGLEVALVADDAVDAGDWACYLAHAGAVVRRYPEGRRALQAFGGANRGEAVLVFEGEHEDLAPLSAAHAASVPAVVRIGGNEQRSPYRERQGAIHLGGVVTCRALCEAVAIAAGRADPARKLPATLPPARSVLPPTVEEAAARGRLILVAEDNRINRMVVERQLGALGCAAEFAEDGRSALQLWRTGRYALLFTDLHMPEMDGYELAATIRREEGEGRHLPIIAFTANALRDEDARCREAGMDDYLSKPVSLDRLQAVLEKWLPAGTPRSFEGAAKSAPPGAQGLPAVLDASVLAKLVGDDPATVSGFLAEFREAAANAAQEIRARLLAGDWRAVGAAAHRLRSSACSVGAMALGEVCARLERAGKSGDAAIVREVAADFENALLALMAAMQDQETAI